MAAEWLWEPEDFAALWYSEANDRIPFPIRYTSRLTTMDEVAAHRDTVRARYDRDELELIELALHTLTTSDLRIEIGGDSTILGRGAPREYRILGARTPYHSMILTQTAANGVDDKIRCRLFGADRLGSRMGAIIPQVPPGSARAETFHVQDLQSGSTPADYSSSTPRRRFESLTGNLTGSGVAGLIAGSLYHHPTPWYATAWFDRTDDGRYIQHQTRDHITVRPAAPTDLSTVFNTWIEHALTRLREDEAAPW